MTVTIYFTHPFFAIFFKQACDSHLMHSRRSGPKNPAKAVLQVGIRLITTLGMVRTLQLKVPP